MPGAARRNSAPSRPSQFSLGCITNLSRFRSSQSAPGSDSIHSQIDFTRNACSMDNSRRCSCATISRCITCSARLCRWQSQEQLLPLQRWCSPMEQTTVLEPGYGQLVIILHSETEASLASLSLERDERFAQSDQAHRPSLIANVCRWAGAMS